jgi:hypothetical protein
MLRRLALTFTIVAALSAVGTTTAGAQSPPPLSGEALFSFFAPCNDAASCRAELANPTPAPHVVQGNCDPQGVTTFTFDVSGTAAGPYSGTFTEHASVTFGPQTLAPVGGSQNDIFGSQTFAFNAGPVLTWDASFTIASPTGQVSGTKQLVSSGPVDVGVCADLVNEQAPSGGGTDPLVIPVTGYHRQAVATHLAYTATIHPPTGPAYRDSGTSQSIVREAFLRNGTVNPVDPTNPSQVRRSIGTFGESFVSNDLSLLLPDTEAACKDGGWEVFGVFKNQGDCVSFVATGGKNPPAG